jgi:hypothetical protein
MSRGWGLPAPPPPPIPPYMASKEVYSVGEGTKLSCVGELPMGDMDRVGEGGSGWISEVERPGVRGLKGGGGGCCGGRGIRGLAPAWLCGGAE